MNLLFDNQNITISILNLLFFLFSFIIPLCPYNNIKINYDNIRILNFDNTRNLQQNNKIYKLFMKIICFILLLISIYTSFFHLFMI